MKSKLLEYKGYYASINVSVEDECMFGKVEFINDSIVDDYLDFCAEVGKAPDKTMTGSFNVRIGEDLHKKALIRSKSDGVTLNDVIKKSVEQYVNLSAEIHNHVNVSVQTIDKESVITQPFEFSPDTLWTPSKDIQNEPH